MSTNVPAKTAPAPTPVPVSASGATGEPRKLDDVLLAMDVVDTLRHREQMVGQELDAEVRETQLIERLKEIYGAQGIQVPDRILKDGVKALEEQRFVYKPPAPGLNVSLAKLYITRKRWMPMLVAGIFVIAVGVGAGWFFKQQGDAQWARLPSEITQLETDGIALAIDPQVDARISAIAREGQRAVADRDRRGAEAQLTALKDMKTLLGSEYDVRIVSRPGEESGFYRTPEDAPTGRNYYLVVEPVAPGGRVLTVPVKNEETQKVERVSKWAQKVSKEESDKVREDKNHDGIVDDDVLGTKARGELAPKFVAGVEPGVITKW